VSQIVKQLEGAERGRDNSYHPDGDLLSFENDNKNNQEYKSKLAVKLRKGFGFENSADDSANVSQGIDGDESEEEKAPIVDRIAAGFGNAFGIFNDKSPQETPQERSAITGHLEVDTPFSPGTNAWLQQKGTGAALMEKMGRSTWANLKKEGLLKHKTNLVSNEIYDELTDENG
jgi:hypothetical protein